MMDRRLFLASAVSIVATPALGLSEASALKGYGATVAALDKVNLAMLRAVIKDDVAKLYLDFVEHEALEPNDKVSRDKLLEVITTYLANFKERQVLCNFKVVCDDSNNPASLVASGLLQLDVFWATPVHTRLGSHDRLSIGQRVLA